MNDPARQRDGEMGLDEHEQTISKYYGSDVLVMMSLKIDTSKAEQISSALAGIEAIEEIYLVTGDIDIIAKARFKDYSDMRDLIIHQIGSIAGVKEQSR
jgi:DNA-binding Lrp family transcriptional regulator